MNHIHHPTDKLQRKLIAEKKHHFVDTKKGTIKAERPARVRHKLTLEELKKQETEEELRDASVRERNQSGVVGREARGTTPPIQDHP